MPKSAAAPVGSMPSQAGRRPPAAGGGGGRLWLWQPHKLNLQQVPPARLVYFGPARPPARLVYSWHRPVYSGTAPGPGRGKPPRGSTTTGSDAADSCAEAANADPAGVERTSTAHGAPEAEGGARLTVPGAQMSCPHSVSPPDVARPGERRNSVVPRDPSTGCVVTQYTRPAHFQSGLADVVSARKSRGEPENLTPTHMCAVRRRGEGPGRGRLGKPPVFLNNTRNKAKQLDAAKLARRRRRTKVRRRRTCLKEKPDPEQ